MRVGRQSARDRNAHDGVGHKDIALLAVDERWVIRGNWRVDRDLCHNVCRALEALYTAHALNAFVINIPAQKG